MCAMHTAGLRYVTVFNGISTYIRKNKNFQIGPTTLECRYPHGLLADDLPVSKRKPPVVSPKIGIEDASVGQTDITKPNEGKPEASRMQTGSNVNIATAHRKHTGCRLRRLGNFFFELFKNFIFYPRNCP